MANSLRLNPDFVRIVVADRTPMNSQLLAEALAKDSRFKICAALSTSSSALSAVSDARPHVVVVSAQLDDGDSKGFDLTRELHALRPETRVIMLLDSAERNSIVEAFRAGARGVFCRNQSLKLLAKCVHRVHSGQVWANSHELAFLLDLVSEMPAITNRLGGSELLSKRQQEVVQGVAKGLTNREIARHLGLTEHTVKNYLFRIFDKLGVSTRVELVLHALATPEARAVSAPEKALPSITRAHLLNRIPKDSVLQRREERKIV
jgi:two-component system, NarL family, nitrate/nitrite response regulator NarL